MRGSALETKRQNKTRILRFISRNGSASKAEISAGLRLSMPTTLQYVKELQEAGIVEENGVYESTGGRKARALSIVRDLGYVCGADITGNHLTLVLVNTRREIVASERIRVAYENSPEYNRAMCGRIDALAAANGIEREKLLGVGFSYPGIFDGGRRLLLRSHTLGVQNVGMRSWENILNLPVSFENDANCAACAELDDASENAVYLSLSNTVGGAIYFHNQLYRGENYKSAEFGHMVIERDGKTCYCGKKGCADAYCSALLLQEAGGGSLEDFFQRLREKDEAVLGIWEEYLKNLAVLITNLRMAFDCPVVLGGYVGSYLEEFRAELDRRTAEENKFDPDTSYIKTGKYGVLASAYGATLKHIDSFFESL